MKKTKPNVHRPPTRERPANRSRPGHSKARGMSTAKEKANSHSGIETFTARELQKMDFPPIQYAIEGYIAEGLTLLGGKPKIGKSWMAVDLAMAIAKGNMALGSIPCRRGTVLYCALEDNKRRLQRRMRKLYGDESSWPKSFHFTTHMDRLDEGGLDDLHGYSTTSPPLSSSTHWYA